MNRFFLRVFFALIFSFSLIHAEDIAFIDHDPSQAEFDPTQIIAEAPRVKRARAKYKKVKAKDQAKDQRQKNKSNSNAAIPDTWKLKFDYPINIIQPQNSVYYQFNVGVGFLYFSGVKGNLMGNPPAFFSNGGGVFIPPTASTVPLKGSYTYNRTPLFESVLGYRILPWFKAGISYQHQSGVTFQTAAMDAFAAGNPLRSKADFISNLSLDGLMAKFCFEGPHPAVIRKIAVTPNLSLGIGIGWQTWSRNKVLYYRIVNRSSLVNTLLLRQKISANCIWMADFGLRFQSTDINSNASITMGCKYNQWGQARSIGKLTQQGSQKVALLNPFRIKTVYQFAPYLGVQWNFPNTYVNKHPYTIDGKNPNRFVPMITNVSNFQPKESLWTQFNAGVGFLYFSGVRANFAGLPRQVFNDSTNVSPDVSINAPLQGRLRYNKTPLFEYLIGYRFLPWFKAALSYQHQGNITVQSRAVNNVVNNTVFSNTSWARFTSNLSLDAIEAKFFFELPYPMVIKNVSCSPFLAVGGGIGWQTWSKMQTNYYHMLPQFAGFRILRLHQKVSENFVWSGDVGFRWQSAFPNPNFSILTGCRYNQWGQARNMGKLSQQSSHKFGLSDPLKIKTMYQIAPYIGVQWNFANIYANKRPYSIEGKSVNRWKPFFVNSDYLEASKNFWTQFNVAPGFLYFSDVRANFALQPNSEFIFMTPASVPYRGRLSYNKTPLFEYLLGYQFLFLVQISIVLPAPVWNCDSV